jgi:hypothetical protein
MYTWRNEESREWEVRKGEADRSERMDLDLELESELELAKGTASLSPENHQTKQRSFNRRCNQKVMCGSRTGLGARVVPGMGMTRGQGGPTITMEGMSRARGRLISGATLLAGRAAAVEGATVRAAFGCIRPSGSRPSTTIRDQSFGPRCQGEKHDRPLSRRTLCNEMAMTAIKNGRGGELWARDST